MLPGTTAPIDTAASTPPNGAAPLDASEALDGTEDQFLAQLDAEWAAARARKEEAAPLDDSGQSIDDDVISEAQSNVPAETVAVETITPAAVTTSTLIATPPSELSAPAAVMTAESTAQSSGSTSVPTTT